MESGKLLPENLASPAAARHARARTSRIIQNLIHKGLQGFTQECAGIAQSNPQAIHTQQHRINQEWRDTLSRVNREIARKIGQRTADEVTARLEASDYPAKVLDTAATTLAASEQAGLSTAQTQEVLSEALTYKTPGVGAPEGGQALTIAGLTIAAIHEMNRQGKTPAPKPIPASGGEQLKVGYRGASWEEQHTALAETMSTTAYNSVVLDELAARGFTHKRWVSYHDNRVRPTHAALDGATIPLGSMFDVGGSLMRYPADPQASDPNEVHRCRCIIVGANPASDRERLTIIGR